MLSHFNEDLNLTNRKHLATFAFTVFLFFATPLIVFVSLITRDQNIRADTVSNKTIILTGLGDSITNTGISNGKGWTKQYVTDINSNLQASVQISNLATNGITSQQLLDLIVNNATYRQQIASAQLITLEIGYNDFLQSRGLYQFGTCGGSDNQDCLRNMVTNFSSSWDSIISEIKSLTADHSSSVALRAFDIYYSVAGADQSQTSPYNGQFSVLNPYLTQMNTHIAQSASQNGFLLGSVHEAYNGSSGTEDPVAKGYISADAIHPTDLGHTIIANRMLALRYYPLMELDTDNDGCSDSKELAGDWKKGGQRDPNNRWDFFDVPVPAITATNWNLPTGDAGRPTLNHAILNNDAQAIWAYFGTKRSSPPNAKGLSYDTHYGYQMGLTNDPNFTDGMFYDRTLNSDPNQFWKTGQPKGAVTVSDAQLEFSIFSKGGSNCN